MKWQSCIAGFSHFSKNASTQLHDHPFFSSLYNRSGVAILVLEHKTLA